MKALAPQGEWLREKILSGKTEIAIIFMGQNAKDRAEGFLPELPYTMYLPYPSSPHAHIWPVHGCEIYLVDTDSSSGSFLKIMLMCLFAEGATTINYISSRTSSIFRRN